MGKSSKYIISKFQKILDDPKKLITYVGPSMTPTLKAGDRLHVIPYDGDKIRRGDVIVFIPPEDDRTIVHRVIFVDPQGIRTRGDNNRLIDSWVISSDQILGRVVYKQRRNSWRRVYGGTTGRLYAVLIRSVHGFDSRLSYLLHPIYHWLARIDILRRLLQKLMITKIIVLNQDQGNELQLLIGQRIIGRRLSGASQWQIQRPFRLFVDEASLPDNHGQSQSLTSR